MKQITVILIFSFVFSLLFSQTVTIEGYVFQEDNRGFLNEVSIRVLEKGVNTLYAEGSTNLDGMFTASVPIAKEYILRADKNAFLAKEISLSTLSAQVDKKVFFEIQLEREPGYIFEMTLADENIQNAETDAITGTRIEVYNNTKKVQELDIVNHPRPTFSYTLEQGNHYTMMIRKGGYFNKRLDMFVNVAGCILCVDGVSNMGPGVSDNLTEGLQMGTLLANVNLQRAELNKTISIENIYYDYNKADIKKEAARELDKLILLLKDNPVLVVELGSHTDSRGSDKYNLKLSQKRAESAVKYIIDYGGIDPTRIKAKGYGETQLVNKCLNGVKCSAEEHQKNRRTELKIVGFADVDPFETLSLAQIIEQQSFEDLLKEIQDSEVIEVRSEDDLPPEIREQIRKQNEKKSESRKQRKERKDKSKAKKESKRQSKVVIESNNAPIKIEQNTTIEVEKKSENENFDEIFEPSKHQKILKETSIPDTKEQAGELEISVEQSPNLSDLPSDFTGYKVEIITVAEKLKPDHKIFTQHGNIIIENKNNGEFSYLLGSFIERGKAQNFLNDLLIQRYPRAKVVQYVKGERVPF
ncbi:MAG: OmpA family protein [Bacteroidetes bacterium]|nr:OmpA family protein [Bacteroidota bacterium]